MDATAVREWARANGYDIGTRGKIKDSIIQAYILANGVTEPEPARPPTGKVASPQERAPRVQATPRATEAEVAAMQALPLMTPGVAESFGPDPASVRAAARAYAPSEARADELTDDIIAKAQKERAAIVRLGPVLRLYRDTPVPDKGFVLLDWRVDGGSRSR